MADLESQLLTTDPEVIGLQRNRQIADLLTGQAFNQPQGQMISGRYVKPSALQQALPMIQAAIGGFSNANLDTKEQQLLEDRRLKQAELLRGFANAKTPQEKLAFATNPLAPKFLQNAAGEMFKPQKLGEGETISQLNFDTGAYEPMAQGGQKIAPEVRQAMQLLGINKPLDQLNPQELQAINVKTTQLKQAGATNLNVNMGQHGFDNALKLRENFKSEPTYKAFNEIQAAANTIQQAAKMQSPAGDLAAANKVFKMLDPSSITRESELGMAMAATGVEDKVRNYANLVITGQKLTPSQREDFVRLSNTMFDVAGEQYNKKRNEYADIAKANNLSVEAAVPPEAKLSITKQTKPNAFGIMPSALDAELKRRGL